MYLLLGQGIRKCSSIFPVSVYPGHVGGFQVLIGFLGLKGFLVLDAPHGVLVTIIGVLFHKDSFRP